MADTTYKRKEYTESDSVKQAQAAYQQQAAQKPGAYQSQWQTSLNDAMGRILNREKFSYDLNGDALYQQYKDRYVQQGKQAMMDTMGQATALTGGYGNSYAQSVGQQTYQGHLQGLNDKIPELYQLALDKYNAEGQDLINRYGLLADRENQDYGRHRDAVADWGADADRLYDQYRDEQDVDYGRHIDDRNFTYQQGRDQAADTQWQAEFDEAKRRYDQEWAAAQIEETGGGSGGPGRTDGDGEPASTTDFENRILNAGNADSAWLIVQEMIDSGVPREEAFALFEKYYDTPQSHTGGTGIVNNPLRKDLLHNYVRT